MYIHNNVYIYNIMYIHNNVYIYNILYNMCEPASHLQLRNESVIKRGHSYNYTQIKLLEMLINQTEFRLYLPFSD